MSCRLLLVNMELWMMLSWGYCGVLPLTLLEYSNEFDIVEKPLPMNGCKAQTLPTKLQNGIEILTWFSDFYLVDISSAYLRLITKGKQIVAATQGPLQLTGRSASIIRDGCSSLASLAIKTMWGQGSVECVRKEERERVGVAIHFKYFWSLQTGQQIAIALAL